jgi:glycogen operon protein
VAHRALCQTRFLHGETRAQDGCSDVEWQDFTGGPLQWRDPGLSNLCLIVRCSAEAPIYEPADDVVVIAFNRSGKDAQVKLPPPSEGCVWLRGIDTSATEQTEKFEADMADVAAESVVAFVQMQDGSPRV